MAFFDPVDGSSKGFRNVGRFLPEYMVLYIRI